MILPWDRPSLARQSKPVARHLAGCAAVILTLLWPSQVFAQESDRKEDEFATPPTLSLPGELADGRKLRAVGVFRSQLLDLVPQSYEPVAVNELSRAINETLQEAGGAGKSRLRSSFYDIRLVDGDLISERERSSIVIESDQPGIVRRSLGPVNMAIAPKTSILPRLEFAGNGDLIAVLPADASRSGLSSIDFSWSLAGSSNGPYRDFDLIIPRTPETRIVLSTPVDVQVIAKDGVLRSRPSIPPGAEPRSQSVRWYEIEAGGLSRIRLRAFHSDSVDQSDTLVVRRSTLQYELDSSGIRWRQLMTIQTRGGRSLPPLEIIGGGVVTSVEVDQVATSFDTVATSDGVAELQIQTTLGSSPATNRTTRVTIAGDLATDTTTDWLGLPRAYWTGSEVLHDHAIEQAQINLRDPLSLVSWELPESWVQRPAERSLLRADGPPLDRDLAGKTAAIWSRLRLADRAAIPLTRNYLKLTSVGKSANGNARIEARATIDIPIDPARIKPIRLTLEPRWKDVSISLPHSGRIIAPGTLTIWPEPEDVRGRQLLIEVSGVRQMDENDGRVSIPPTWIARVANVRAELTAAILPPADLNWSGLAAVQPDRVALDDLSPEAKKHLGDLPDETLLFRSELGVTPRLQLKQPDVSFGVHTSLRLRLEGGEILETLSIEAQQTGQRINSQLSLLSGPSDSRPPYRWSLRGSDDQVPINLPTAVVEVDQLQGLYSIDLGERNLRGKRLVGRRQYRIDSRSMVVQLPAVLDAATQNAEVLLGPGLALKSRTRSVELVPLERSGDGPADSLQGSPDYSTTRLRYDPGSQPTIEVSASDHDTSVAIVWQQDVSMTASSRGSDSILARIRVSSSEPIEIDYDPDLHLSSLSLNGQSFDVAAVPQRPIRLPSQPGVNSIRLRWNRNQLVSGWLRECTIPQISVAGVHVKNSFHLTAANDTFIPSSLVRAEAETHAGPSIEVRQGSAATLMHRNLAMAGGWLFAALFFSACWTVARRTPMAVATFLVIATTSMVLWWPWRLPIIGWVIIPAIAAMMLETSRRWTGVLGNWSEREIPTDNSAGEQSDRSLDFSFTSKVTIFLGLVTALTLGSRMTIAQRPSTRQTILQEFINVLVPMDETGNRAGDKVYIPGRVYDELFSQSEQTEVGEVTIQNANYRVDLGEDSERLPEVKADYLIHVGGTNQVHLPFDSTTVRRVQWRQGDETRILKFSRDPKGILLNLPTEETFDLRLTLIPTKTTSGNSRRLRLNIPSIASSRLLVDTSRVIQDVRIAKFSGTMTADPALRRWTADLGPVTEIDIAYSIGGEETDAGDLLQRRYWISAGKKKTSVECQIEPTDELFPGDTVQLEIRHEEMPHLLSPTWQLLRESSMGSSRRITLVRVADTSDPIRLFWSLQSNVNDLTSTDDSAATKIPEVVSVGNDRAANPIFAISHDPDLQVTQLDHALTEPIDEKEFLEQWRGNGERGTIEQAFVSTGPFPTLLLMREKSAVPVVTQKQQLHVTDDHWQLRYTASISAARMAVENLMLQIPTNSRLLSLRLNGQTIDRPVVRSKKIRSIALGEFGGVQASVIQVVLSGPMRRNRKLIPPVISLSPLMPATQEYVVTRSADINLSIDAKQAAQPLDVFIRSEQLIAGRIPVAKWIVDTESAPDFSRQVSFQASPKSRRFACQQLISASYDDGAWAMESLIRFNSSKLPDYIEVQIPTRWCDSLEVDNVAAWTRAKTIDPAFQLLRIAPGSGTKLLSIRGKLDTSDQGGISVPRVQVLGDGSRTLFASVPKGASGRWRSRGAQPTTLPETWSDVFDEEQERLDFRIQNQFSRSTWRIELQPQPDIQTVALAADVRVFLQDTNALVLYRWDLIPGSLTSVVAELPRGATCLGAWTAQRPVKPQPLDLYADDQDTIPDDADYMRIPLSISRLSQPVELLMNIPMRRGKLDDYMPNLLGMRGNETSELLLSQANIPVQQEWVAVYTVSEKSPPPGDIAQRLTPPASLNSGVMMDEARALALAGSVVNSIDQTLETLAERPKGEVATWFLPWAARYEEISDSVGRRFDWQKVQVVENEIADESEQKTGEMEPVGDRASAKLLWQQLDARMATFVSRFAPQNTDLTQSLFSDSRFDGFTLTDVHKVSPAMPLRPIQSMSSGMKDLRQFLANGLTLLMVCGLVALLWPLRRYAEKITIHPAAWLGLMGLFGLYVAPVPFAIAVVVLAATLPLMTIAEKNASPD